MSDNTPSPMSRRSALKWLTSSAAGAATAPVLLAAPGETEPAPPAYPNRHVLLDPNYMKPYTSPWEKLLTPEELKVASILADIILPKDANGPAASEIGVAEFINEWISAPYDDHRELCQVVRGGLAWMNTESFKRHGKVFAELAAAEHIAIVDDICDAAKAKPEHKTGAKFFKAFRQLALDGYYTHSSTWKHIGYVGNMTIGGPYPGVPKDIIEKYGLQDVA